MSEGEKSYRGGRSLIEDDMVGSSSEKIMKEGEDM